MFREGWFFYSLNSLGAKALEAGMGFEEIEEAPFTRSSKLFAHLNELDLYAVGGLDIGNVNARQEFMGLNRERSALFPQTGTVFVQISTYVEAKMVRAPLRAMEVTVRKFPGARRCAGLLAWPLATDEYGDAFEDDSVLRRATKFGDISDFAA